MVKFIYPKIRVFLIIVDIKNNQMQKVVLTVGQEWVAICQYSSSFSIVVSRLISTKFGTD